MKKTGRTLSERKKRGIHMKGPGYVIAAAIGRAHWKIHRDRVAARNEITTAVVAANSGPADSIFL